MKLFSKTVITACIFAAVANSYDLSAMKRNLDKMNEKNSDLSSENPDFTISTEEQAKRATKEATLALLAEKKNELLAKKIKLNQIKQANNNNTNSNNNKNDNQAQQELARKSGVVSMITNNPKTSMVTAFGTTITVVAGYLPEPYSLPLQIIGGAMTVGAPLATSAHNWLNKPKTITPEEKELMNQMAEMEAENARLEAENATREQEGLALKETMLALEQEKNSLIAKLTMTKEALDLEIEQLANAIQALEKELEELTSSCEKSLTESSNLIQSTQKALGLNTLDNCINSQSLLTPRVVSNQQSIMVWSEFTTKSLTLLSKKIALLEKQYEVDKLVKTHELNQSMNDAEKYNVCAEALKEIHDQFATQHNEAIAQYTAMHNKLVEAESMCNKALLDTLKK